MFWLLLLVALVLVLLILLLPSLLGVSKSDIVQLKSRDRPAPPPRPSQTVSASGTHAPPTDSLVHRRARRLPTKPDPSAFDYDIDELVREDDLAQHAQDERVFASNKANELHIV